MKKIYSYLIFFGIMILLSTVMNLLKEDRDTENRETPKLSQVQKTAAPAEVKLNKRQVVIKTLQQVQAHLQKFDDEDLLFFAPRIPDNFEVDVKIDNLGQINVKVWEKGQEKSAQVFKVKHSEN